MSQETTLKYVHTTLTSLLEELTIAINAEEIRLVPSSAEHLAIRVRRLLAGGEVDTTLGYGLDGTWHLGMIGVGLGIGQAIRSATAGLGCQLLCIAGDDACAWAWLGGQHGSVVGAMKRLMSVGWPRNSSITVGEVRQGIEGWRQTHQEAKAALLVARHSAQQFTRCIDVILESAMLRDDILGRAVKDTYLSPLDDMRIGGGVARETLRTYFETGQNIKKTAERLQVDRRTIWHRLEKIRQHFGWPLETRRVEFEVALRLEALDH